MTTKKATSSKRGKPKNVFLKDEDIERIRELAHYLTGKGHRVSDSQVIAASLRVAKADTKLLKAFEESTQLDARLRKDA
jgi:hypothetical protein